MHDTPIALIPARAGSKRITAKNVRPLNGHPLIAYTIGAALESGIFADVIVSTDSEEIATIARHYGAEVPFLRPAELATDAAPDIGWIEFTLRRLGEQGRAWDAFGLLRPTSPLRLPATVRRAWERFKSLQGIDSLRAVERARQHPGKMWLLDERGTRLRPLLPGGPAHPPWHSTPTQELFPVFVQNASLELAWTRVPLQQGTIAGDVVAPFFTEGLEGFDLNGPEDWLVLEQLLRRGEATLPAVRQAPWSAPEAHA